MDARVPQDIRLSIVSRLANLPTDGVRIIKSSCVSDVYCVRWGGRDLVVKRYHHSGLMHALRHTVKGSRARRSWINGWRLLDAGVRTPLPVAYMDEYRDLLLWQSWLITEYVDKPTLYAVLHDASVPEGRKRRLTHQALRLVDRLGLRGISHGDMKHTNMLCDDGQIVLTDLDGVEIHKLGWLHRHRRGRDIARFLREIGASRQDTMRRADVLDPQGAGSSLWMNQDFRNPEFEEALLAGPQGLAERFQARPVPSATTSHVCRFSVSFDGGPVGVYFKEYLDRSAWDRFKRWVRPSRAMRALRASQMLTHHGFHTPEMIAVGYYRAIARSVCFMATREITDAMPIYRYVMPTPAAVSPCSLRERRELLRQLGLTIGRMHSERIVHGDLRPGNILVRRRDNGWEFFLIDNERTRRCRYLPPWLRRKNLVQLNMLPHGVSRTDRLRFFLAYLYFNPSVCLHRRRWADRIMTVTHRRFRKKGWVS